MIWQVFNLSCTSLTGKSQETVDMPDVKVDKGNKGNEVVFNDSAFEKSQGSVATFGESKKEINQTIKDGSQITAMSDGYGNKIETRYFFNHPNLKSLTVKTFADGHQEILVFGHNGERKKLAPETIQQVLTTSGNDIANVAGINTKKIESTQPTYVKNSPPPFYPSATFPTPESMKTQPQLQTETTEVEQTEPQSVKKQTTAPVESEKNSPQLTQIRKTKEGDN